MPVAQNWAEWMYTIRSFMKFSDKIKLLYLLPQCL